MTQAVAKVMVDQGVKNGSIVNLASIVGKVRKIYIGVLCSRTNCLKVNREF